MTFSPTIKAKPGFYRKAYFDSRMEQRWAAFSDNIGIDWDREPNKFEVDGFESAYIPDFKFKHVIAGGDSSDLYAEVRPAGSPNGKALALSKRAPVLFLTGEPVDNEPMVLRYRGTERTVRISGDGHVVLHQEGARPIDEGTDARVLRAVLRSQAVDFEALQAETLSLSLGIDPKQLTRLSHPALLVLHIINAAPSQPNEAAEIQSRAVDAGLSPLAARDAVQELLDGGLLADQARRHAAFKRTFYNVY